MLLRMFLPNTSLLLVCVLTEVTTAQSSCDPLTQYEHNGECCQKCRPGMRMTSNSNCREPQCRECDEMEYQSSYTTELKCKRQKYCDPNLNFESGGHRSKTEETPCRCKEGFHCAGQMCQTCVQHQTCEPGYGARLRGNATHDTVCQGCPEGTFSDEKSWDGVCEEWTKCGPLQQLHQAGTASSDNICQETTRGHGVAISVSLSFLVLILAAGGVVYLCRGSGHRQVKSCLRLCGGSDLMPQHDEEQAMVDPPVDAPAGPERRMLMQQQPSVEESCSMITPEENAEPTSEEIADVPLTDNGNYVMQENGKSEKLSRQESQTHTLSQPSSSLPSGDFK